MSETQIKLIQNLIENKSTDNNNNESNILKSLNFILYDNHKILDSALDLMDDTDNNNNKIIKYKSSSSSRVFWKVNGSQGNQYLCFEKFCPCQSFLQQARQTSENIYCKHILSIKIGSLFDKIIEEVVDDNVFVEMLTSDSLVISKQYSNTFNRY